ncbi:YceI family protein [Pontibacter burrus]|uniref:YceI family protein n=1 Tax=Pontibacter burrus TaxID=2704466 RepID=A0A6B3LXN2_9BACT|nr:YceI family protein [Pontibacter burrus]NEM99695.1 YceI family protein [Pontibacter burrus]
MSGRYGHNIALIVTGLVLAACDTTVNADKAEVGAPVKAQAIVATTEVYTIDTAKSTVTWIGAKLTGRHNGIFKIDNGQLTMHNKLLTGGKIEFNMLATRSDDKHLDEAGNEKLTTHLRSADFFDVERFPRARFVLTSIAPYDSTREAKPPIHAPDNDLRVKGATHYLTGNLTIKDKTKSIRFPARITLQDSLLKARANFNIDRTDWDLIYRSDKSLGNQTIHPDVNIDINLVAIQKHR